MSTNKFNRVHDTIVVSFCNFILRYFASKEYNETFKYVTRVGMNTLNARLESDSKSNGKS